MQCATGPRGPQETTAVQEGATTRRCTHRLTWSQVSGGYNKAFTGQKNCVEYSQDPRNVGSFPKAAIQPWFQMDPRGGSHLTCPTQTCTIGARSNSVLFTDIQTHTHTTYMYITHRYAHVHIAHTCVHNTHMYTHLYKLLIHMDTYVLKQAHTHIYYVEEYIYIHTI